MLDILIRAGSFVAIIILGNVLRRINFFKEEDFTILSKIVLRITLPGAIVSSFVGKEIDPSMLLLSVIGLGFGLVYIVCGYLMNVRAGRPQQAFGIINTSGYNIGNFTMPFVQSFLGPMGVIVTSLFDVGNACVCLGGAYSVASIVKEGNRFSVGRILKNLTKSVAFDCYIIVTVMTLLHIPIPSPVASVAGIIGNANAFLAMLMIGVGFKLSGDFKQIGIIVKTLGVRFGLAIVFALACYFLLPFSLEIRQTLVLLVFSPIATASPAFTKDIGEDAGLASAINSISIICSIVFIVGILLIMLK